MTRPYNRLTPQDQRALADADWSTPWPTARALGARLKRDPRVLLIWAQNRGLAPRGRKRLVTADDVQAIREGVEAGLLGPSIARTLGLSAETVRRVMHREGIMRARPHEWTECDDGDPPVDRCARCGTRRNWPGAKGPCVKAGA